MKQIWTPLLIIITVFSAGCFKQSPNATLSTLTLAGTFNGPFTYYHKRPNGKVDTSTANITLTTTTSGLFKVTGDTSKVHAGSHGYFILNPVYAQFVDSTATVLNPPKVHLFGIYEYSYDGAKLQIAASNDTLAYFYNLQKQ